MFEYRPEEDEERGVGVVPFFEKLATLLFVFS